MTSPQDRRFEPRSPSHARGVVLAAGLELPCLIADQSSQGLRLRLERSFTLPKSVTVIDIAQGAAVEVQVAWQKGNEAGVKRIGAAASLRGLAPSRLLAAREAWMRAGGR